MKRETLCLVGALLLSSGGIGWLLNENRWLRGQLTGSGDEGQSHPSQTVTDGGKPVVSGKDGKTSLSDQERSDPSDKRRFDPSGSKRFRDDRQQSTKQENAPGRVSVVRIQDGTGNSHRTGEDVTADESPQVMTTVVPAESTAKSLLKNGGFNNELAPWVCENGKLVPDPVDPENMVLEVRSAEPRFRLSQTFQPHSGKRNLTLTFRTKFQDPVEGANDSFGIHLSFQGGKTPIYTSRISAGNKGERTVISVNLAGLRYIPDTLVLENSSGSGTVWIDDVTLK